MRTYPKVTEVQSLSGWRLRVTFSDASVKVYDCSPLLREPQFRLLESEAFFRCVHVDRHGYGVAWSDEVDLAESELWLHGTTELPASIVAGTSAP